MEAFATFRSGRQNGFQHPRAAAVFAEVCLSVNNREAVRVDKKSLLGQAFGFSQGFVFAVGQLFSPDFSAATSVSGSFWEPWGMGRLLGLWVQKAEDRGRGSL